MPHALTYDNLPAHSRLRREFADGALKIVATPEEPGPLVRREALLATALTASLSSFLALAIGALVFGPLYLNARRTMPPALSVVLLVASVVFYAAVFCFAWRIRYVTRITAASCALQQTTVLAASKERLLIESTGPCGAASRDLAPDSVLSIRVASHDGASALGCIEIQLLDSTRIGILIGRDQAELCWVAQTLGSILGHGE